MKARAAATGAALLLACLAVAGCFSEHTTAEPPGEDLCATGRADVVEIRNFAFHPARLRVEAGTRVTWVNCDEELHTATADTGAWSSPLLAPGASFSHTFTEPGDHGYHCQPHPFMTGRVTVD